MPSAWLTLVSSAAVTLVLLWGAAGPRQADLWLARTQRRRGPAIWLLGCCRSSGPLTCLSRLGTQLRAQYLLARTQQRSLIFFAPAGISFALCLLLTLVSATVLPQLTVTLLIPTFFFGALLAGAAAGYRREGLWLREGRMTLRRQQGLYLHCICVLHPDVCLTAAQSPWAASVGRTNLTLTFPGWVKLKVRSVPLRDAEKFFRFMETN